MKGENRLIEQILKNFEVLEKDANSPEELFREVKSRYEMLDEPGKEVLFSAMINRIEVSKNEIENVVDSIVKCDQSDPNWPALVSELRVILRSPRMRIFRKISHSAGGLKFLLDFRGDLLSIRRYSTKDLDPLDTDITFLFELLFQEGFFYLEEITLNSSFHQIALLKDRDLVHPMASIEEMGQRLGKDRRCFALYHRLIPYEPIIFIEVALTEGLVKEITRIMATGDKGSSRGRKDTAIFYSINNTQNGLAGLGLGKMLIGKVVEHIREDDEKIKNFATLSPLPGFWKGYLKPILEGHDESFDLKHTDVISFFSKKALSKILADTAAEDHGPEQLNSKLISILSDKSWAQDSTMRKTLRAPLVKIAYYYVAQEKNRQNKALNPVANFHLENGAKVSEKGVNFLANPSERGLRESCGIMINYIYTSSWLSQLRRSILKVNKMEIRSLFSKIR
jgi:hypothetical protein